MKCRSYSVDETGIVEVQSFRQQDELAVWRCGTKYDGYRAAIDVTKTAGAKTGKGK